MLYKDPQEASKSILSDYHYWTSKTTESSFALSLAVIGANWAVFGSVDKILNNICAEISIAAVILNLVISLLGSGWLGLLLRRRIVYAEKDAPRWEKQFHENKGKSTYWPSTRTIDWSAFMLQAVKILLPVTGGIFFLVALFSQPKPQKDESHFGSLASPTPSTLSLPSATASIEGAQSPSPVETESPLKSSQASEEIKADAPATQSPKANEEAEETEEMNDWHGVSPDEALFAVTRFIPDPVYMQRHDHDGVAVGIFRGEFQTPAIVARHNFRGLFIAHIEWSPDSKFLLFTTANSNGVSPWHAAAFVFCAADKSFRYVDAAIGDVVSPKFHFEPPNIASMEVKKGEAEEDVKVSLSKAIQQMPRVK